MKIWELLDYHRKICPSCGSIWFPVVSRPLSCPRCKSYTVSKNRQPMPEGYADVYFNLEDFEIRDPFWIAEQNNLDKKQRVRKYAGYEQIHANWMKNFSEHWQKETSQMVIATFKNRTFIPNVDNKTAISKNEVHRLIQDLGVLNRKKTDL